MTFPLRRLQLSLLLGVALLLSAGSRAVLAQDRLAEMRDALVTNAIEGEGVKDERVLRSMRTTPRHEFVPANLRNMAYYDMALPIGSGQTISPPYIVAFMTEKLDPQPTDKVLEIGTGSGYQAAVLSPLVKDVYTIEIVEELGKRAGKVLEDYPNVHAKIGDGFKGWPEFAPFDKIIVTCSPEKIPQPLIDQLRDGGRMVIPLGERFQQTMYLYTKKDGKLEREPLAPTLFVPMTGTAEDNRVVQPDPTNPHVVNGSFEEIRGDDPRPTAWHYVRQGEVVEQNDAPAGKRYIRFENLTPGRGAQCLQAFGCDGRAVKELDVSYSVRGTGIRPGLNDRQVCAMHVLFFDSTRRTVSEQTIGSFRGTFDWQPISAKLKVPSTAREAIVHIGLTGATGMAEFDDVQVKPVKQ